MRSLYELVIRSLYKLVIRSLYKLVIRSLTVAARLATGYKPVPHNRLWGPAEGGWPPEE